MKCIKSKSTSEIKRMPNETAYKLVNSGEWQYCPKHEYKTAVKVPAENKPTQ